MAAANRRTSRSRYATIGATLGRYRTSLNTPEVESWLRERQPDNSTNPEPPVLTSQADNCPDNDSEGMFAMFDSMEERNPGMFDSFLEHLTKWGMRKLAANIRRDLQVTEEKQDSDSTSIQKSESRLSMKSNTSTEGDENVVVTIPGNDNVVHLHMHNSSKPAGEDEPTESNRESREDDPNGEQGERLNEESDQGLDNEDNDRHQRPDNEHDRRRNGGNGGGFLQHIEQDPSLEHCRPLTKVAERKLKNSVRGTYKMTNLADHSDGTKECLLSFKGPSIIIHRRVFRNSDGYSFNKGEKTYLCVSTLVRSLDTGCEKKDDEKEVVQQE